MEPQYRYREPGSKLDRMARFSVETDRSGMLIFGVQGFGPAVDIND
jgi:hypothetical protein